jgi:hypothetical protein
VNLTGRPEAANQARQVHDVFQRLLDAANMEQLPLDYRRRSGNDARDEYNGAYSIEQG